MTALGVNPKAQQHRAVMCLGKHGHTSRADALKQARRGKVALDTYRCPFCSLWHVGKPRRDRIK
jgi:hypothetical protein